MFPISATKIFVFSLCILFIGCKKEDKKNESNGDGTYYYKATIGGVNYFQDVTQANDYTAGSGSGELMMYRFPQALIRFRARRQMLLFLR